MHTLSWNGGILRSSYIVVYKQYYKVHLGFMTRSLNKQGHIVASDHLIGPSEPRHNVAASDWTKVPYIETALSVRLTLSLASPLQQAHNTPYR